MKKSKKFFLLSLAIFLMIGSLYSAGWAQQDDPRLREEFNMLDLFIARPFGVAAGIAGTGLFILSLPFTIPTRSVDSAAKTFIVEPFRFSFTRQYPDENF